MSNPKVWLSEEEILRGIDRAYTLLNERSEQSKELEEQIKGKAGRIEQLRFEHMKMPVSKARESLQHRIYSLELSLGELKEEHSKIAKSYNRVMDKTLPRLKDILAAFRTRTMPELMGSYKGVVVK